jgi:hypothetical protein
MQWMQGTGEPGCDQRRPGHGQGDPGRDGQAADWMTRPMVWGGVETVCLARAGCCRGGVVGIAAGNAGNEDGQNSQQRCNVNGSVARRPEGVNCRSSYPTPRALALIRSTTLCVGLNTLPRLPSCQSVSYQTSVDFASW